LLHFENDFVALSTKRATAEPRARTKPSLKGLKVMVPTDPLSPKSFLANALTEKNSNANAMWVGDGLMTLTGESKVSLLSPLSPTLTKGFTTTATGDSVAVGGGVKLGSNAFEAPPPGKHFQHLSKRQVKNVFDKL